MSPPKPKRIRVVGNDMESWEFIKPGEVFRTMAGATYIRLPCGHFRNEDAYDPDADGGIRPKHFCWNGCHEGGS